MIFFVHLLLALVLEWGIYRGGQFGVGLNRQALYFIGAKDKVQEVHLMTQIELMWEDYER